MRGSDIGAASGIGRGASALAIAIACACCASPLAQRTAGTDARPLGAIAARPASSAAARDDSSDAARPSSDRAAKTSPDGDAGPVMAPISDDVISPEAPARRRSGRLASGFHNPMPGGVMAGYRADTGLDIAGSPRPIYAIAAGTLDYSEPGHTLWVGPRDTANTVRMELAHYIPWKGRKITHVWYAHLSALATLQPEGSAARRRIEAGEQLGVSGIANHSPHLHIGMLLDNDVSQAWGTFLFEDEIREVLGGYKRGARLPEEAAPEEAPTATLLGDQRANRAMNARWGPIAASVDVTSSRSR